MKIQCPSVGSPATLLEHQPCQGTSCEWWTDHCTAEASVVKELGGERGVKRLARRLPTAIPACDLETVCRWHVQAVAQGRTTCVIRRIGRLCEHQGGDFNTFAEFDVV